MLVDLVQHAFRIDAFFLRVYVFLEGETDNGRGVIRSGQSWLILRRFCHAIFNNLLTWQHARSGAQPHMNHTLHLASAPQQLAHAVVLQLFSLTGSWLSSSVMFLGAGLRRASILVAPRLPHRTSTMSTEPTQFTGLDCAPASAASECVRAEALN